MPEFDQDMICGDPGRSTTAWNQLCFLFYCRFHRMIKLGSRCQIYWKERLILLLRRSNPFDVALLQTGGSLSNFSLLLCRVRDRFFATSVAVCLLVRLGIFLSFRCLLLFWNYRRFCARKGRLVLSYNYFCKCYLLEIISRGLVLG